MKDFSTIWLAPGWNFSTHFLMIFFDVDRNYYALVDIHLYKGFEEKLTKKGIFPKTEVKFLIKKENIII